MSPSLDEKNDSAESNDSITRWSNRNPPRSASPESRNQYQIDRQNQPRCPQHRGQDIDTEYK